MASVLELGVGADEDRLGEVSAVELEILIAALLSSGAMLGMVGSSISAGLSSRVRLVLGGLSEVMG